MKNSKRTKADRGMEALEGEKRLARSAAYEQILKWEGRLRWQGEDSINWHVCAPATARAMPPDAPHGRG